MNKTNVLLCAIALAAFGFQGCETNPVESKFSQKDTDRNQLEVSAQTKNPIPPCLSVFGNSLNMGDRMNPGDCLISPSGNAKLIMQTDGNLTAYNLKDGNYYWQAYTNPRSGYNYQGVYSILQSDGNFVVYGYNRGYPTLLALTWTATVGAKNAHLVLQDDYNIVLYWDGGGVKSLRTGRMHYIQDP